MSKNVKSIIIIAVIILIIMGIWFYKNKENNSISKIIDDKENIENNITTNTINNDEVNITNVLNNAGVNNTSTVNNENNINTENKVINENGTSEDFELEVTEKFNLEDLKSYKLPIILDFGADYCAPCREMKPILKKLNTELRGKAIIKVCDIMEYPNFADGYDISLIPTQIFINSDGTPFNPENYKELGINLVKDKNGKHIYTSHIGYLSEKELKDIIKEMK